jgi:hypothetical protein
MQSFMANSMLPYCFVYLASYIGRLRNNVALQQFKVNKELTMKFDFNIRPAREVTAAEILRPQPVNELVPARREDDAFEPARLNLVARRQTRLARRAVR